MVSIHAPARGATCQSRGISQIGIRFNPRAREGRDTSTSLSISQKHCFNPRAREGRDGE